MSKEATEWAWDAPVKKSPQRIVLLALAKRAGSEKLSWPSIALITKETQLNRKTVITAIAQLIALGHIKDSGERRGKGVIVYELIIEKSGLEQSEKVGKAVPNTPPVKTGQVKKQGDPNIPTTRPEYSCNQYQKRDTESIKESIKESNKKNKQKKDIKNINHISFTNLPRNISPADAQAFIDHRKILKSPVTQRAFDLSMEQAVNASSIGLTPNQAINETILAGWKGINVNWLANRLKINSTPPIYPKQHTESADTNWAQDLGD